MQSDTQMIQHTTVTDPVYSNSLPAEQCKQNPVEGKIPKYLAVQYFLITNKRQYKIRSKNYSEHCLYSARKKKIERKRKRKEEEEIHSSKSKKEKKKEEGCFQSVELDNLHLDRLRRDLRKAGDALSSRPVLDLVAHDVAATTVAHAALVGSHVAAVLQVDGGLGRLAHVVHLDVGNVALCAHGHARLARPLVGAGLQADDPGSCPRSVVSTDVGNVTDSSHGHSGLRSPLVGAGLKADDAGPLSRGVVSTDVGNVTDSSHGHSGLRSPLVGAGLQADDALSLLGHVVSADVGDVTRGPHLHPGLGGTLVGSGLKTDDALAGAKLLFREVHLVFLRGLGTARGAVEPVTLSLYVTQRGQHHGEIVNTIF